MLKPETIFYVFRKLSKYTFHGHFWQSVKFHSRSTLAVLSDQFNDKKNKMASDEWYKRKIGRVQAIRISQELMDDAKAKATSMNFEQIRILSESYHGCKDKGSKIKLEVCA
jgi:hypothetical protein